MMYVTYKINLSSHVLGFESREITNLLNSLQILKYVLLVELLFFCDKSLSMINFICLVDMHEDSEADDDLFFPFTLPTCKIIKGNRLVNPYFSMATEILEFQ